MNGAIASITKAGVTGSYDYDAERRRIRKLTSTGAVIFVYDLEGQCKVKCEDDKCKPN